jgi:hypothetical protein
MHDVAIWMPLAVACTAYGATILIHALAFIATVTFVRRAEDAGRLGAGFWTDVSIATGVISLALVAHLVEIAVWAAIFMLSGDFVTFTAAVNQSAVDYTTLGAGNFVMRPSWKFLEPLEAANGMLMFGVSTALAFAVIQRAIEARLSKAGADSGPYESRARYPARRRPHRNG